MKVFIIRTLNTLTALKPVAMTYLFVWLGLFLAGPLDSEISSTRTACEEAMTVLEEVIMFTFQQSVYYLTKVGCNTLLLKKMTKVQTHCRKINIITIHLNVKFMFLW